jgi:hypothetical protein
MQLSYNSDGDHLRLIAYYLNSTNKLSFKIY